jgi:hypothetical protein
MAWLVRIAQLDKDGVQNYTFKGLRFKAGKGWYRLPEGPDGDALAAELKTLKHDHYARKSPLLFEVMEEVDARALEKRERAEAMNAAAAGEPIQTIPRVDAALAVDAGGMTGPPWRLHREARQGGSERQAGHCRRVVRRYGLRGASGESDF